MGNPITGCKPVPLAPPIYAGLGHQGRSLVSRRHLIGKLTFLPFIFTASLPDEQRLWAKKKVSRMGRVWSRETESKQWQPLEVRGILNRRGKAPG